MVHRKASYKKAIRLLGGKPLLAYTASTARERVYLSCLLLSTEDLEIAEVGRAKGSNVPLSSVSERSSGQASWRWIRLRWMWFSIPFVWFRRTGGLWRGMFTSSDGSASEYGDD